ncbi:MAG: hypothetical protein R6V74_11650 [Lutibacter sp.]
MDDSVWAEDIKLACDLLGINLSTHFIKSKQSMMEIDFDGAEAVILTERVLKHIDKNMIKKKSLEDGTPNVLILDVNPKTVPEELKKWSEEVVEGVNITNLSDSTAYLRILNNDRVAHELGGLEYPLDQVYSESIYSFEMKKFPGAEKLVDVVETKGMKSYPVFVRTESSERTVFFLSTWNNMFDKKNVLLKIAPILMFIKYSFDDRCWHGNNDFANLTIDDPWLREPYGYINFEGLCREAEKTKFHTTIGFIPFNHKKSQNDAIKVFGKCQDYLSIAVHGNNHDFYEFRAGKTDRPGLKKSNDILDDEKSVFQAIDRMENFSHLTGLSYDPVMIFPRGAFTKESLGLLKKYNFLMTVNSTLPLNSEGIIDDVDKIRGITMQFGNFPMLIRQGVPSLIDDKSLQDREEILIRMRLFLDLPVLLYTHHNFFKNGTESFNSIAEIVNGLQPHLKWRGLGDIAKNLYFQKRLNDSEVSIISFSKDIIIENKYDVPIKFIVNKQEDFLIPIKNVLVDDKEHNFFSENHHIRIEFFIDPGDHKSVSISYENNNEIESDLSFNRNMQAFLIRTLSDYRDIYLAKLPFGDKIINRIYVIGGLKTIAIGLMGFLVTTLIVFALYRKKVSNKT